MVQDRIPRPMSADRLLRYRWITPLPMPQTVTPAGVVALEIAPTPHTFANQPPPLVPTEVDPPQALTAELWGYGPVGGEITYPGPLLAATAGMPATVTFANNLPPKTHYPYVQAPYDHAAAAMGRGAMGRYSPGHCVVHLHGAEVPWEYDGHPARIPKGADNPRGVQTVVRPGQTATYHYPNTQRGGGLLWYHDHTMDSTARNVYAGLAGGYILRAATETAAINAGQLPSGPQELALVLQDRSFTEAGELLYADAKYLNDYLTARHDGVDRAALRAAMKGNDPMAEFKGHALAVNGTLWPTLQVEPRPYRLRLLNGANSRYFVLRFSSETSVPAADDFKRTGDRNANSPVTMYQIGSDGGLFSAAVALDGSGAPDPARYLVLAPGERADVLVDFSGQAGNTLFLTNHSAEQSPLGISGDNLDRYDPDGLLLGDVMRIEVSRSVADNAGPECIALKAGNPYVTYRPETDADTASLSLNKLLADIIGAEDQRYADLTGAQPEDLSLGTITARAGAQRLPRRPARVRDFVFKEFAGIPEAASDKTAAGDWVPGRRGWSAITIQSDPHLGQTPGFLWAANIATPGFVGPPPMGGPVLDDAVEMHAPGTYVELWNLWNLSGDTHPIHLHLVNFFVLERRQLGMGSGYSDLLDDLTDPAALAGAVPVLPNESSGWKDTVRMQPGELLRILVQFNGNGGSDDPRSNFVWHCHLIEHEDMGMMRPLLVG